MKNNGDGDGGGGLSAVNPLMHMPHYWRACNYNGECMNGASNQHVALEMW